MPAAGALKERVVFQEHGFDENGDRLGDWTDSLHRRAEVKPSRATEEVIQARQQGVEVVDITIRISRAALDITSAWRAVWRDKAFNLAAPSVNAARTFITIQGRWDGSDG